MGRCPAATDPYNMSKSGGKAHSNTLRQKVWCQGITVHHVEPVLFHTNILNIPPMLASYQHCLQQSTLEVKELYGKGFVDQLKQSLERTCRKSNPNLWLVVDVLMVCFLHCPYMEGWDATLNFHSQASCQNGLETGS